MGNAGCQRPGVLVCLSVVCINKMLLKHIKKVLSCNGCRVDELNMPDMRIDLFTNASQIYGCFYPRDLVTSHFINLYLPMVFQYLEYTLQTLVVATLDKPQTSFQVVRNNLC